METNLSQNNPIDDNLEHICSQNKPSREHIHLSQSTIQETVEEKFDYVCEHCCIKTNHKNDFMKHLKTKKHLKASEPVPTTFTCSFCKKDYLSRVGLFKHQATCKQTEPKANKINNECSAPKTESEEFLRESREAMRQMTEFIKSNNENMRFLVTELCKTMHLTPTQINAANNNTTINNNSNNTTTNIQNNTQNNFNLNLFLNETCKNAVNLSEFIENVHIELDDMENFANHGFINALSSVIIRNLENLGTERRPIHCTDVKRETIYIKENNKWEKGEEAKELFQKMLTRVHKASAPVLRKWKDMHPTCVRSDSPYTDIYNNMMCNIMGGDSNFATSRNKLLTVQEKENKVMSIIAAAVAIDKANYYVNL